MALHTSVTSISRVETTLRGWFVALHVGPTTVLHCASYHPMREQFYPHVSRILKRRLAARVLPFHLERRIPRYVAVKHTRQIGIGGSPAPPFT